MSDLSRSRALQGAPMMTEIINKKHLVEWSTSQGCVHVHTIDAAIKANVQSLFRGVHQDYIPVGIFDSLEDALDYCNEFISVMKKVSAKKELRDE
jgi:hypothetical protein